MKLTRALALAVAAALAAAGLWAADADAAARKPRLLSRTDFTVDRKSTRLNSSHT